MSTKKGGKETKTATDYKKNKSQENYKNNSSIYLIYIFYFEISVT